MRRIYLDSCVVVYLHEAQEEIRQKIWDRMTSGDPEKLFCFSDLTRLECRVGPMQSGDGSLLSLYDRFFSLKELLKLPLDSEAFDRAAELRSVHRLKTPDALHLAAALRGGCDEFWTNDMDLAKASASIRFQLVP